MGRQGTESSVSDWVQGGPPSTARMEWGQNCMVGCVFVCVCVCVCATSILRFTGLMHWHGPTCALVNQLGVTHNRLIQVLHCRYLVHVMMDLMDLEHGVLQIRGRKYTDEVNGMPTMNIGRPTHNKNHLNENPHHETCIALTL
jgi:hypothetical protein